MITSDIVIFILVFFSLTTAAMNYFLMFQLGKLSEKHKEVQAHFKSMIYDLEEVKKTCHRNSANISTLEKKL